MAKHHPDLIFCRKQPGVGEFNKHAGFFLQQNVLFTIFLFQQLVVYVKNAMENV